MKTSRILFIGTLLFLMFSGVCMSNASANIYGPYDEDKVFFRVHIATGVMFCNDLPAGAVWYISGSRNFIWEFPEWVEDVNTLGNGNEQYFMENLNRGTYGIGVVEDNRCETCKTLFMLQNETILE
jgi:hypothetical protein